MRARQPTKGAGAGNLTRSSDPGTGFGMRFKHTLRLILFTGEEQGLVGSRAIASQCVQVVFDLTPRVCVFANGSAAHGLGSLHCPHTGFPPRDQSSANQPVHTLRYDSSWLRWL